MVHQQWRESTATFLVLNKPQVNMSPWFRWYGKYYNSKTKTKELSITKHQSQALLFMIMIAFSHF